VTSKEVKQLLARAVAAGWKNLGVRRGHIRLEWTNGARITVPSTPSDWRSLRNATARLTRVSGRLEGKKVKEDSAET
jgi:hypothetical protein